MCCVSNALLMKQHDHAQCSLELGCSALIERVLESAGDNSMLPLSFILSTGTHKYVDT